MCVHAHAHAHAAVHSGDITVPSRLRLTYWLLSSASPSAVKQPPALLSQLLPFSHHQFSLTSPAQSWEKSFILSKVAPWIEAKPKAVYQPDTKQLSIFLTQPGKGCLHQLQPTSQTNAGLCMHQSWHHHVEPATVVPLQGKMVPFWCKWKWFQG